MHGVGWRTWDMTKDTWPQAILGTTVTDNVCFSKVDAVIVTVLRIAVMGCFKITRSLKQPPYPKLISSDKRSSVACRKVVDPEMAKTDM